MAPSQLRFMRRSAVEDRDAAVDGHRATIRWHKGARVFDIVIKSSTDNRTLAATNRPDPRRAKGIGF